MYISFADYLSIYLLIHLSFYLSMCLSNQLISAVHCAQYVCPTKPDCVCDIPEGEKGGGGWRSGQMDKESDGRKIYFTDWLSRICAQKYGCCFFFELTVIFPKKKSFTDDGGLLTFFGFARYVGLWHCSSKTGFACSWAVCKGKQSNETKQIKMNCHSTPSPIQYFLKNNLKN